MHDYYKMAIPSKAIQATAIDKFGHLPSVRLVRYHILVHLQIWVKSGGGGVEVEGGVG